MGPETHTGRPEEEPPEAPREDSDVERVESGEQSETGPMPEEVERAGEREAEAAEG